MWWLAVVLAVTVLLLVLSYWPIRNLLSRGQLMNASFNRWQLVNTYGAFGTVTRHRVEIVVEGTQADVPVDEADWREYGFKGNVLTVRVRQALIFYAIRRWGLDRTDSRLIISEQRVVQTGPNK